MRLLQGSVSSVLELGKQKSDCQQKMSTLQCLAKLELDSLAKRGSG